MQIFSKIFKDIFAHLLPIPFHFFPFSMKRDFQFSAPHNFFRMHNSKCAIRNQRANLDQKKSEIITSNQ
jgi:hypothetical protein